MSLIKTTIVCIVLALLCACTSVSEMQTKLDSSTQSTSSITEMNFLPLKASQEQKVTLGENSPTYVFESGKNYYAAFSLPDPQSPKYLKFKLYLSTTYAPNATVLIPQIILLDDKKQIISILKDYRVERDTAVFHESPFTANIPLPVNVSYIVLYAASSHPEELFIETISGQVWTIPLGPAGNLALTLGEPLPANHDFSTAIIKDTANVLDSDKADIFYVLEVDGKAVKNSMQNTISGNQGRGMTMDPKLLDREIDANKIHILTIVGATHYAAPIQEIIHKTYQISGKIQFSPEKNKKYVVTGELGEGGTSVWIEEEGTHKIMDKKIEGH